MARRIALHFSRLWKAALYGLIAFSFSTGLAWFYLHRWIRIEGEFGEEHSSWEPVLMRFHGASAMLLMIYFGYLLASHVPVGLRSRRNKLFGLTLMVVLALLIITSYGLYYAGAESLRAAISWTHLGAGLSLPVLVALHVWVGHRSGRLGRSTKGVRETGMLKL